MIYVVATLRIRPGSFPQVAEAVKPNIAATRKEDGCILYDLHQSVTDPERVVFIETWSTREALTKHLAAPKLPAWNAARAEYVLESKVEIITPENVEHLVRQQPRS